MEKWNGTTLDLWQEALPKHMSRLQETFAPMATFASIHTSFALVIIENMEIHQMDVKTTFIKEDLHEETYME